MRVTWEETEVEGVMLGETGILGPTLGVMGGVHGNERAGYLVVEELKEKELDIVRGSIMLIVGNPKAVDQKVRFTEENLNRCFRPLTDIEQSTPLYQRSYEVNRAQELLPILDRIDALLDLHEFDYSDIEPFIICERNALETARSIGAPVISFGWSQSEAGGSDGYMFEAGKEGICYELGDLNNPSANIERGRGVVKRFLSAHGLLDISLDPLHSSPTYVQTGYAHKRTGENFVLGREFKSFEKLTQGEVIAIEEDTPIIAEENEVIIFPKTDPAINTEAFTIGKVVSA